MALTVSGDMSCGPLAGGLVGGGVLVPGGGVDLPLESPSESVGLVESSESGGLTLEAVGHL